MPKLLYLNSLLYIFLNLETLSTLSTVSNTPPALQPMCTLSYQLASKWISKAISKKQKANPKNTTQETAEVHCALSTQANSHLQCKGA